MYRIFCVEDDETIGKMIKRHLEKWEYDVHVAKNLSQVMTEFAAFDPQLVLMDIRLPFYNGYYWCTEIRKVSNVPVIFLSSVADNMNIVMAMNMGGDDFIPKPFDLEVLTAKIQALLRRSYDFAGNSSIMEHKGAVLNLMDATLTWAGQQLELTKNELKILHALLEHKEKIVSREELMGNRVPDRMKTWKSFVKRNIEWMILSAVLFFLHVLYLFLIGRTGDDLIYAGVLDLCIITAAVCMAYIRYYRKVRYLKGILQQPFSGELKLPETEDLTEELLGQLAENANIERQLAVSAAARQQSEMKDYYAKWVHQIKTPIAGLQLLLQMERGEQENAESGERMTEEYHIKQLQNLTDMEEELFRIEEYVGMALQYQRLNSNSNDYILKQISLDTVIREVIHKYARIMIRRKIRLHYEKTNVSVISDEKWLAFVLEQLLSNAVKYTPGGELTIEVQEEPQQIWLKIRDTGIGIRSEDIPRVFEKGYTGFNGHEDKRSTGIGLYLCRDALQKLGHTIRIQSEIGEGTVVTVGFYKDTIDVRD